MALRQPSLTYPEKVREPTSPVPTTRNGSFANPRALSAPASHSALELDCLLNALAVCLTGHVPGLALFASVI